MFRSATFKLTLYYIGFAMILSILFSSVIYRIATIEISNSLHNEADRIFRMHPDFFSQYMRPPTEEIAYRSHRLLLRLISLNIAVIIASGLASFFLARRTLRPIERAHERQKRFTADVSHELRTPLTVLRMESEVALLGKKTSAPELKKTLKSNLEEVTKLENLINNLLRLSSLEAGELQRNFEALQIRNVADAALATTALAANDRKIMVTNHLKKTMILGDGKSLEQLLIILLDNAIKYSVTGSAVTLKSHANSGMLTLQVIDHGKGITPEALRHVFDRFYRADEARTKESSEGFGLGLSIAKTIVDVHSGAIDIQSTVGKGTTVTVKLPRKSIS
jgi:two-component system sensor histidine kinase CiaH